MRVFTFRRQLLIWLVAILALTIGNPLQANAQDVTATVSTANVNLRSGPGLNFNEVGAAKLGDIFPVLGRAHGSDRIWYNIQLPNGGTAWISERVVNIDPSPDSVPWLGDNPTKTPLVMDCGSIPPVLYVESYAQVTLKDGLVLTKEAGLGKTQVGYVAYQKTVKVMDGPFCTRLAKDFYQTQWLVETVSGLQGYMLEGRPDGNGGYIAYTTPTTVAPTADTLKDSDRPATLTDANIADVTGIFHEVQDGKIDQDGATTELQKVVDDQGKPTLAWIVRRVPIYDGKTGAWESFARYNDQSLMAFDDDAKLDTDPVSVTTQVLFGNYQDPNEIWASMGCGGG